MDNDVIEPSLAGCSSSRSITMPGRHHDSLPRSAHLGFRSLARSIERRRGGDANGLEPLRRRLRAGAPERDSVALRASDRPLGIGSPRTSSPSWGAGLCQENGPPLTQRLVQGWVLRPARSIGLRNVGVHVLRHTFCSHLAMRGGAARAIQELAGHRDLVATQRYMHLVPLRSKARFVY
jgi:integrase